EPPRGPTDLSARTPACAHRCPPRASCARIRTGTEHAAAAGDRIRFEACPFEIPPRRYSVCAAPLIGWRPMQTRMLRNGSTLPHLCLLSATFACTTPAPPAALHV